jgi:hypothetical protein
MSDEKCPLCGSHEPHLRGSLCCVERQLLQAGWNLDASRKIRQYVALVLTGDDEADVQVAADQVMEKLAAMTQRAEKADVDLLAAVNRCLEAEARSIENIDASLVLAAIDRLVSEKATKIEAELHRDGQTCVTVRRWWRDRNGVYGPREFTGPTLTDCLRQAEEAVAAEKPATGGGK